MVLALTWVVHAPIKVYLKTKALRHSTYIVVDWQFTERKTDLKSRTKFEPAFVVRTFDENYSRHDLMKYKTQETKYLGFSQRRKKFWQEKSCLKVFFFLPNVVSRAVKKKMTTTTTSLSGKYFFGSQPVWPYFATFCHFGNIVKVWQYLEHWFSIRQNSEPTSAKINRPLEKCSLL